jgi:hypothetical protein
LNLFDALAFDALEQGSQHDAFVQTAFADVRRCRAILHDFDDAPYVVRKGLTPFLLDEFHGPSIRN